MIESLDEAAERASELLTAGVGDVVFDELGAIVYVRAKRKKVDKNNTRRVKRGIRLIKSATSLAKWLEVNPRWDAKNAPLWANIIQYRRYEPLTYEAAPKDIQDYARHAGIMKKVNFLSFRHSSISRTVAMDKLKQPALCITRPYNSVQPLELLSVPRTGGYSHICDHVSRRTVKPPHSRSNHHDFRQETELFLGPPFNLH
jgi:hypothetical protein